MPKYQTTAYRYPSEQAILTGSLLAVLAIIAISAAVTLSLALIIVLVIVAFSYISTYIHHQAVIRRAYRIRKTSPPDLRNLVGTCLGRIQPGEVQVYVATNRQVNAYTFGISDPKVIVLYSSLFDLMDADELKFILGHEMGHVSLGHTWLNSLVGGLAGIPASYGVSMILNGGFRWWNRACEFSADRAGLLACNNPDKAISALVKLATGKPIASQDAMVRALQLIKTKDDDIINKVDELLSTHPLIARRIETLRRYISSSQYKKLQARVNKNLE